jgi:hypothetical protein
MSAIAKRLVLLPLFTLLIAAKTLVDPPPVQGPDELSAKEINQVLRTTLVGRGWLIGSKSDQEVVATLHVRTHSLTVRFAQLDRQISMIYVDSVNLDYRVRNDGTRMIHRKYAEWMNNVAIALAQDFQRAVFAKSPQS